MIAINLNLLVVQSYFDIANRENQIHVNKISDKCRKVEWNEKIVEIVAKA